MYLIVVIKHQLLYESKLLQILVLCPHIGKLATLLADHHVCTTFLLGVVVYRIILDHFLCRHGLVLYLLKLSLKIL